MPDDGSPENIFSHSSEASLHDAVFTLHSAEGIKLGVAALARYQISIQDPVERVKFLDHLLSEASEAARAITRKMLVLAFNAEGGPIPGVPTGMVQFGGGSGLGFYRPFENGAIFWRRDLGAFWVHGAILAKYMQFNSESGILGYPLTDETETSDRRGRYNHFEGGSIYWHPMTGAFEIHGAIRDKWRSMGAENLGYPVTDELGTGDGSGRFNHFQDVLRSVSTVEQSIYWTPATGAHFIQGPLRRRWAELGWERSFLGYPIDDQGGWSEAETGNTGLVSRFQRGSILWRANDQKLIEVPDQFTLNSGHIGVSSIGGWVELTLTSAGFFTYRGHLHNSGFVGMSCTVSSGLRMGSLDQAVLTKKTVGVGGTASLFDDRDEDWSDSGYSEELRANWDMLKQPSAMVTRIEVGGAGWDVLLLFFLPLIAVGTGIALIFGGGPSDTKCKQGPLHTVKDGNNNTIAEPSWTSCGSWY
jgi:hypothetical protein